MSAQHPLQDVELDDGAFDRLAREEILPALQAMEGLRLQRVRMARWTIIAGVALSAALVALGFAISDFEIVFFLVAVVGIGCIGASHWILSDVRAKAKSAIIEPVAKALGLVWSAKPSEEPPLSRFSDAKLLPGFDRATHGDQIKGSRHGAAYDFWETKLEQNRKSEDRDEWVTVFRGQILRIGFPQRFLGRTLVLRDAGMFNALQNKGDLKRAKLEDPRFEKAFEVFTNDQVEARSLLTPIFMERLTELETLTHGKRVRCAFDGGEFLLALEGGDLFEAGSMFKPLAAEGRISDAIGEFRALYAMIDLILKRSARA